MALKVLDSWALLAFFEDEPAADAVEKLILDGETGKHRLMLCAVNWGEIYYTVMRRVSRKAADEKAQQIAELPIEIIPVGADLLLAREAAALKAQHKLACADAFAAALAKLRRAELVTGDPEFTALEDQVKIRWLR